MHKITVKGIQNADVLIPSIAVYYSTATVSGLDPMILNVMINASSSSSNDAAQPIRPRYPTGSDVI